MVAQVRAALGRNTPVASLWDGLLLASAELTFNDRTGSLFGVHGFDTVSALYQGFARADNDRTRALLLLAAADRLPGFRPRRSASPDVALDRMDVSAPPAAAEVTERAFRHAGMDLHRVKYPAAVLLQAREISPRWRPHLLTAVRGHWPDPRRPAWTRHAEAEALLS